MCGGAEEIAAAGGPGLLPLTPPPARPPSLPQGIDAAMQQNMFRQMLLAGLCFHSYQQLSYMILGRVTPVTHAIGNCVKRVVVSWVPCCRPQPGTAPPCPLHSCLCPASPPLSGHARPCLHKPPPSACFCNSNKRMTK